MILLFPAGSEALVQEIYALPAIEPKGGGTVAPVKLGTPGMAKDGRLAFSHPFDPMQIEWVQQYAKAGVEIIEQVLDADGNLIDELPKDWEPTDETDPAPPPLDLELTTKPADPGPITEPDDKTEWEKPPTKGEQDALRDERKAQWQATLPDSVFE